jgi:uncharacterized membrane protein
VGVLNHFFSRFVLVLITNALLVLQDLLFNNLLNALFGCTAELGMSLILLFAASAMRAGTFTVGSFAAL